MNIKNPLNNPAPSPRPPLGQVFPLHELAKPRLFIAALLSLLLYLPVALQAQFTCVTNNDAITITGYTGPGGDVVIPAVTNGLPVTDIRTNAFFNCTNITSLTIPGSIADIAYKAFTQCTGLTNVTIGN